MHLKSIFTSAVTVALTALPVFAAEVRPGVEYAGTPSPADSGRAVYEDIIFDFAAAWANCDKSYMEKSFADDVLFSYPTTANAGLDAMLNDLDLFCGQATDTSFYFPKDAFYIDEEMGRVAVEVQFRTIQRGNRQVVNDVWIATVEDGKGTVLKEYLDGRVKDLQALGVLQYEESPEFMTPWPPRTEEWESCFPIVRAAPINQCDG